MQPADSNVFSIASIKFWALGDRLIIQEDEFKTGYECPTCGGSGHAKCNECAGSGINTRDKKCSFCEGNGNVICPDCQGKGGLLVAPETAQRRPTSGKVVSIGPKVTSLAVGDAVLYSNFSGYLVELQDVTLRILHETEILAQLEGHLTLNRLRSKSDIAAFAV